MRGDYVPDLTLITEMNQALSAMRSRKNSKYDLYFALLIVAVAWGRKAQSDELVARDLTRIARAVLNDDDLIPALH